VVSQFTGLSKAYADSLVSEFINMRHDGSVVRGGRLDDIFPIPRIERNILNEHDSPGEYYNNHHTLA
jgi:hypothetical protein